MIWGKRDSRAKKKCVSLITSFSYNIIIEKMLHSCDHNERTRTRVYAHKEITFISNIGKNRPDDMEELWAASRSLFLISHVKVINQMRDENRIHYILGYCCWWPFKWKVCDWSYSPNWSHLLTIDLFRYEVYGGLQYKLTYSSLNEMENTQHTGTDNRICPWSVDIWIQTCRAHV